MNDLKIYIDGASKGNPGHSGIGVVIYKDGRVIQNISNYIGETTNNIAEYTALIYALEAALLLKANSLEINTDSQLLARQLNKIYKVRHAGIINLYNQAMNLAANFENISVNHIPREENASADRLATQAIKKVLSLSRQNVAARHQTMAGGKSGLQRIT